MEYKAALYLRLSKEDESNANESESIVNQKSLLIQYAKENSFNIADVFADDGFSGGNFDRPSFKKMIESIEQKEVNMVIVKDAYVKYGLKILGSDFANIS